MEGRRVARHGGGLRGQRLPRSPGSRRCGPAPRGSPRRAPRTTSRLEAPRTSSSSTPSTAPAVSRAATGTGAVAVALVESGRPIIGVVHAPALGDTYAAIAGGGATWLNGACLCEVESKAPAPRPEMRRDLPRTAFRAGACVPPASSSISGRRSPRWRCASCWSRPRVYERRPTPRATRMIGIMAAADLVLQEAGGLLADLDGAPLVYNRAERESRRAHGDADLRCGLPFRDALARTPFG